MHLILIADVHLAETPSDSFGVDTLLNFDRVLQRVAAHRPDHVVLMGDYSLKAPKRKDVQFIRAKLRELNLPFSLIPGNHDRSFDVAEAGDKQHQLIDGEIYFKGRFEDYDTFFLDTAQAFMREAQIHWLKRELAASDKQKLVFMHHPPIQMGVPFMDNKHAFKDPDHRVYDTLFEGPNPIHVFSGHYHTARSTHVGRHSVHLCPSTYFQLNPMQKEFGVSHAMPGIRHVELIGEQVRTWIEFIANKP